MWRPNGSRYEAEMIETLRVHALFINVRWIKANPRKSRPITKLTGAAPRVSFHAARRITTTWQSALLKDLGFTGGQLRRAGRPGYLLRRLNGATQCRAGSRAR
jgi:hypothetical protein